MAPRDRRATGGPQAHALDVVCVPADQGMLFTNRAGVCAADREGLQGAKRSNSRSHCAHLQRSRPPEAADAHDAMIRERLAG